MHAKLFAVLSSLVILMFVIELIRRQKMTFKYSVIWLTGTLLSLLLALQPPLLETLSSWAGFSLPSNFIFFLLMIFVTLLGLLLTIFVNEQNSRSEILAQSIAALEYKMRRLQLKESRNKQQNQAIDA